MLIHSRFLIPLLLVLLLGACDETSSPVQAEVELPPVPVREYRSIEEAVAAAGFHCPVPASLPRGYSLKLIETIEGGIIQILYHTQGKLTINYRVAQGNQDISDIRGSFTEKKLSIDGAEVLVRLKGKQIVYATWLRDGLSFALSFDKPINESAFVRLVESIPRFAEELGELPLAEPVEEDAPAAEGA